MGKARQIRNKSRKNTTNRGEISDSEINISFSPENYNHQALQKLERSA
jgi:hypothetical protein